MGNTGPYILGAAVITFAGVLLGLWWQGIQANRDREAQEKRADRDRQHALQLARAERDSQENRAKREWFRAQRFSAYTEVMHSATEILAVTAKTSAPETARIVSTFNSSVEVAAALAGAENSEAILNLKNDVYDSYGPDGTPKSQPGIPAENLRKVMQRLVIELEGES